MKKMLAILCLLLAVPAFAQTPNPVTTQPKGVVSSNASDTIDVTNTFQSIWTRSTNVQGRLGCIVQNNGSGVMYVYLGSLADATTPTSLKLAAGGVFNCGSGVTVLQDGVSITGTAGEEYFAVQQ